MDDSQAKNDGACRRARRGRDYPVRMSTTASSLSLSDRVSALKPSTTLAVTARVRELIAAGEDVIGFGAGEPDFDTPDPIKEAAIEALREGRTRYEPVPGAPSTRKLIASKFADENGIKCTGDDVVVTVGAKSAIYLALQALVNPGQEVIILTPAWVSYRPMIELCGGRVVEVPGAVEDDFLVAPEKLEAAITPNTAAVILNSPSNPCGSVYAPAQIRALADVVARHEHVALISDEIYEKLIFGGAEHFSPGSMPAIADRVVTINGLSKAYAMTGWRLGYVCAPGNGLAKAIAKLQSQINSHPVSFGSPAIESALRDGAAEVERMRATFAARAARMYKHLSALPGVVCPEPKGAFYVFPDVAGTFGRTSPGGRQIDSSLAFAEALLEEAKVAVVPGADFGTCAANHVRLSFACNELALDEGCRRIAGWVDSM